MVSFWYYPGMDKPLSFSIGGFSKEGLRAALSIGNGWKVEYELVFQEDRLVTREIRITPGLSQELPKGGLTATVLRSIRIGDPIQYVEQVLRHWRKTKAVSTEIDPRALKNFEEAYRLMLHGKSEKAPSKLGRKRIPALELAKLARDYVQLLKTSKSPVVDLAKKNGLSQVQARARIYQARERGILESAMRGRGLIGGQLSVEARELLKKGGRRASKR